MKRLLFIALFGLISCLQANAQTYGNEWIEYSNNRVYLKFPVYKNSLYRIDYNTLSFAVQLVNESIENIDPRSIQIFAKGEEQYIYIDGQNDGTFDNGDFIEFYGEKNDGWFDEQMYPDANAHTNPYYSLYNDTIYYFLTWNPSGTASPFRITHVPYGTPSSTPASHFIYEHIQLGIANYNLGKIISSDKPVSTYNGGKGWTSGNIGYNGGTGGTSFSLNHQLVNIYAQVGAPNIELKFGITSANNGAGGLLAHHIALQNTNSTTLADYIKPFYYYSQETFSIAPSSVANNSGFVIRVSKDISQVSANADYSRVSYFIVKYPRTPIFSGNTTLKFYAAESTIPVFFNGTGFSTNPVSVVYDLEMHKRLEVSNTTSNGGVKFNIEAGNERPFYITTNAEIISVPSQNIVAAGVDGKFTDYNLNLDSAYIIITHPSLMSQVQLYSNYRSTKYNTTIIDVTELYEQFGYGINLHPISIRYFIQYAFENWPSEPQFLFLVGKSVSEDLYRKSSGAFSQVLVPTMGYPSSDNMISAGLNGNPFYVAALSTGRLAANTTADVKTYLDKIKAQENQQQPISGAYTINNKLWQKRILHFAGGGSESENATFRNYLQDYADYAEDSLMGAQRILFSKTSSNTIEQLDVDSVRDLIREGVSIMTFFGHGSGNNFDVSVDNPEDWGNEFEGRYPLVIANSCFSGNIHRLTSTPSISEDYVFTPNEGAIAFMATPSLSFEGPLNEYTAKVYKHMSKDMYGKTLGEFMRASASEMNSSDIYSGVALEMTLHGDPALKVFPHEKPEITINDPEYGPAIRFEPNVVTTELDSFDVIITLTNLGRSVTDPFEVTINRTFESGAEAETQYKTLDILNFQKEVRFRFGIDQTKHIGKNWFSVSVDMPLSIVDEFINYGAAPIGNNEIDRSEITISSSDIFPIFPYDFAVVPDFDVTLKANTGLPFLEEASYTFEIDTTDLYSSPWKRDTTISQAGAVLSWNPRLGNFNFEDSTVFFWRVTPSSDLTKWREYSFQVIDQKTGWGQDHFYQYKEDRFDFLNYSRNTREVTFDSVARSLFVNCLANPPLNNNEFLSNNRYTLDGQNAPMGETGVAPNGVPSLLVVVIDSINLKPWGTYGVSNGFLINQDHQFGNTNNYNTSTSRGRRVEYWFSFQVNSSAGLNNVINLIDNVVENGNYILVFSAVRGIFQDTNYWKEQHYAAFESLGADSIRHIPNNNPYIFLVKKGYPNTAIEVIGKNATDPITLDTKILSNIQIGEITGPSVGPAKSWDKVYFKHHSLENNSFDRAETKAIIDGTDVNIYEYTNQYETDINGVIPSHVSTLNLRYFTKDSINLTPAQLSNWHVMYAPAPEAAVNPNLGALFPNKKIEVGTTAQFAAAIENVSDYGFDALRVRYWLIDSDQEVVAEQWLTYDTFAPAQVILDTVSFSTVGLGGDFTIWMEVNPEDSLWHIEQFHFNNTAFKGFTITGDTKNPILDVTFDGVHILNGDIVSPSPEIHMVIKDENTILFMEDTTTFDVYLTNPSAVQKRISFIINGQENMFFEPASGQNNKAKLTWNPQNLADGKYTLQVMGRDAVGNMSGTNAYKIDFEVINKSTVSSVMNYPNPFTTSTRFVFTLTGSREPDVFTIQIMTVTGKVVREITKDELGNIRIGRNITDYAWDGTDEFGDRLANGVYLYRVIMKIDGEAIERRTTGADQYFIKDFGKMYLFR